jgi:transcriptional regulator with XRE-family HTH domain
MTLSERISLLLEKTGDKKIELARKAGVKPSSVSAWISGKTKNIMGEPALNIAESYGLRIRWVVSGTGSMYEKKTTSVEWEAYSQANEAERSVVDVILGVSKAPWQDDMTEIVIAGLTAKAESFFNSRRQKKRGSN